MSKGETVKYIIDADTSGFARGMAVAATEAELAGKKIDRSLTKTSRGAENNFTDIRRNASTAANQIRNFGVAMQAFNTTSLIIGVTALTGAIIELSGAIAAAGSTVLVLAPALAQAAAGAFTYSTAISGLDKAFKALQSNNPDAWAKAMATMGPAGQEVARSLGGIFNAFQSIKANVQEQAFKGIADQMLRLGSSVLPTVNVGMQQVAQSINGVFKEAARVADTPLFKGLLATIFQDTARNVDILSGAIQPLLTAFTDLYLITRPYVTLLAQGLVNLTKSAAAYLSSAKGQAALNLSIQEGIVALQELGHLTGAVFGLLTSLFRTSVNAGNALIPTLTGIINNMKEWVNSAEGQAKLIALFRFTSLALTTVANAAGTALNFLFSIVQIIDSLNPTVQKMVVNFLAAALTIRPLISYVSQLYLAIRVLAVTLFNFGEQALVVFAALGAASSIALVLAGALIIIGNVINGPLGGALIILGVAIATFITLNYLLGRAATYTAGTFFAQGAAAMQLTFTEAELAGMNTLLATTMYNTGVAAINAGAGMSFAARAAAFLQAAIIPLLAAAAGLFVILSLLGVFGGKAKSAGDATQGFSSSLSGLQKAMKGIGSSAGKVGNGGLSALNDSLAQTTDSADKATGSLASFDKMNVLTDNSAGKGGITGLPSLPNLGGAGALGAPTLDTGDFDKQLADMEKNFRGLAKDIGKPFANPFQALADWINSHPWIMLGILGAVVAVVAGLFIAFGVAAIAAAIGVGATIGLIVLAVAAVIAIIIILAKNWDTVWNAVKTAASVAWQFLQNVWDGILNGAKAMVGWIGDLFQGLWDGIKALFNTAVDFFTGIFEGVRAVFNFYVNIYKTLFTLAWEGIKFVWNAAVGFFQGIWTGVMGVFSSVGSFFANAFGSAWNSIRSAFGGVTGFFQGIWNGIVGIFGSVGTSIGNAVGDAFKGIINQAINWVTNMINGVIRQINGAINIINKIPKVNISSISTISLPRLAKGGVITSPTFAQIGEDGAEAVVPLERNTEWIDKLASKINSANGGGNGQPINLVVKIGEEHITTKVIDLINEKTQMSGRNTILV